MASSLGNKMIDTPAPLWERQEPDTKKSYEAFCWYRDMGGQRSLEKVSQKHTKNLPTLKKWSRDHNWQVRIQEWDDYQDTLRRERKLQKQIELEDNVVSDYDLLRAAIEKRKELLSSKNYTATPRDLSELLLLMRRADDYARRAVGLPDKITESKTEVTGKDGGKMQHEVTRKVSAEDLSDDELASILAGLKVSSSE